VRRILEENGIATRPVDAAFKYTGNLIITAAGTLPMIDIILGHPLCRFFVSALGTQRPDVIRRFHEADVKVGALAGNVQHAVRHVQGARPIVGQIVGHMNAVRSVREVMDDLVQELVTTIGSLPDLLERGL
jgi:NAD(P)H-dependent flavin oxidoreductase YrpB (nitropropane dioxygenase family)